jgi:hypothetical protein
MNIAMKREDVKREAAHTEEGMSGGETRFTFHVFTFQPGCRAIAGNGAFL